MFSWWRHQTTAASATSTSASGPEAWPVSHRPSGTTAEAVRAYRSEPLFQRARFVPDIYELDDEAVEPPVIPIESHDASDDAPTQDAESGNEAVEDHADPAHSETTEMQALEAADEANTQSALAEADEPIEPESVTEDPSNEQPASPMDEAMRDEVSAHASEDTSEEVTEVAAEDAAQDTTDYTADGEHTELHASEADTDETEQLAEPDLSEADLAQDDVMDSQALAQAEAEAVEAAVDAAIEEAHPEPVVQGVDLEELARREAEQYQLGYADGERIARDAMAQEIAAQRTVLRSEEHTSELQSH